MHDDHGSHGYDPQGHGFRGYGSPTQGNPYAAPMPGYQPFGELPVIEEGNYALGIALGFLLGLWGLIGCHVFAKPRTKRGSLHGFLARVAVVVVIVFFAILLD